MVAVLAPLLSCAAVLLFASAAGVLVGAPTAAAGLALVSAVLALAVGVPVVLVLAALLLPDVVVLFAPALAAVLSDLPLHAASAAAMTTTLHAILFMLSLPVTTQAF